MGKIKKPVNTISTKSTRVIKQNRVIKPRRNTYLKRILILERRLDALRNEKCSWEEKNKDILDNLKNERELSASLRKESFRWQRLYHESLITVNTYKVKQAEMVKVMSACLRGTDNTYPHLVGLSETITNNKVMLTNMLTTLPSSEYNCLPRQFGDAGKNIDSPKLIEKPTKHRVGPMVRGLLITKPKIMLERVMLPQPQDQEPVNTSMSPIEVNNQLTPIPEVNEHDEEVRLRRISVKSKRKLGLSWRVRRQEKLEKERERERVNKSSSTVVYDGDSSDTESNPTAIDHMEPVVRFKDVSRLLQNSSLLKVDTAHSSDGNGKGSTASCLPETENRRLQMTRPMEDPLEGSSWMYNNNPHSANFLSSQNPKRRTSLYKSDTSDDDDEEIIVPQTTPTNLSSMNTLAIRNQTFTVRGKDSLSAESTHDDLDVCPAAEPDSTNNVDVQLSICSSKDSLGTVSRSSIPSSVTSVIRTSNISTDYSILSTNESGQRISINSNSLMVRLSKVSDANRPSSSSSKSKKSFCNNCSPLLSNPEVTGKRVRKPKSHLYPGEDGYQPQPKTGSSKVRLSSSKKSPGEGDCPPQPKEKSNKTRLSTSKRSSGDFPPQPKKNSIITRVSSSKKSVPKLTKDGGVITTRRRSSLTGLVQNPNTTNINCKRGGGSNNTTKAKQTKLSAAGDKTENKKSVKSLPKKKSCSYSQTSSTSELQISELEDGRPTRSTRTKGPVSYKEPPANIKLRRT